MKIRVLWRLVLIIFAISITMGCIGWGPAPAPIDHYESEVFEEEYYMAPGSIIIIEKYIKGVLDVEGWQEQNVNVSAMKRSLYVEGGVERINIQVIEGDAKLEIKVDFDGDQQSLDVRMYIRVPKNVRVVNITTSAGPVHLKHTVGNTTIESRSGNVIVEDVDGIIDVKTSNGFLNVGKTRGITSLVTSNGDMRVNVDGIVSDVEITTSNGNIVVIFAPDIKANVTATTSNGKVIIYDDILDDVGGNASSRTGKVGGGGHQIVITTTNADIKLFASSRP